MIVRLQGEGQFELNDDARGELEKLDGILFEAIDRESTDDFHVALRALVEYVEVHGSRVPDDRVVPSDAILPSPDTSLDEAKRLFTDEGYLTPVEA